MSSFIKAFYSSYQPDVKTTSADLGVNQTTSMTSHDTEASQSSAGLCDMTSVTGRSNDEALTSSTTYFGWLTRAPKKSGVTVRDVNVWAPISM